MTSIQRLLGHKKLNTTMIYARIHDKAVAEDYYQAIAKVEEGMIVVENWPVRATSLEEMLRLVDRLRNSTMNTEQIEIVSALRPGLAVFAGQKVMMNVKVLE